MPDIRSASMKKYNISSHRFMELYHFCLQYNEWKDELYYKCDTVKSMEMSGMPTAHNGSDQTAALAMRREELERKCRIVEQTVIEADAGIYQYLLKAVTNEGITYAYLKEHCNIPCGKNYYYDKRRKFFWILSKKI